MEKIYLKFLAAFVLLLQPMDYVKAQCSIPAPVVSGNTLICNSTGSFTLTASSAASLVTAWYANSYGGNALTNNPIYTTPNLGVGTTTYYAGQIPVGATQSITLPPHVTTILAMSRGYWFVAPTSFVITGIRVPTDASPGIPSVAILKFGATPPTYPTTTNSFSTLYLNQLANTGTNIIPVYVPVYSGDIIGVLGDRNDTTSYSPNPYNGTLGANPITLTRMGMLFNLSTTAPQDIWTESINNIGRVEIYTTIGCLSTLTPVPVVVSPPPQITISAPAAPICNGVSTTLTASGANNYTWTNGPVANTTSISITPNSTTTYSVIGTNLAGCPASAGIQVTVIPLPAVTISSSSSVICTGKSATLTLSGATTYTWSNGFNTPVFIVNPNVTTTYSVTGTDAFGCTNSTAITMPVSPTPTVGTSISPNLICVGQSATITATGADTYSWSSGPTTQKIIVNPTASTSYTAIGTTTAGCSKSSVIMLSVIPCTGIEENTGADQFVTAFPNPANDRITIQSGSPIQQVEIKDVTGRTIFEQPVGLLTTFDLDLGPLNAGVYFIGFPKDRFNKVIKVVKE